ncbi:mitochondrial-processing peptidase subunit alpha-like protein [Tanacetum coccineum]
MESKSPRKVQHGSIYETPATLGASHVLEPSASREQMGYTYDALKTYVPQMVELLVDCVRNQAFKDWEINEQIQKVKAEIAEYANNPEGLLLEAVHSAGYTGALANPLLASEGLLNRINSDILEEFVAANYTAPRMVLAASGVEHEELLKYAEPLLSDLPGGAPVVEPKSVYVGGDHRVMADTGPLSFAHHSNLPGGWQKVKEAMTLTVLQCFWEEVDLSQLVVLEKGCIRDFFGVFVSKAIDIAANELIAVATSGEEHSEADKGVAVHVHVTSVAANETDTEELNEAMEEKSMNNEDDDAENITSFDEASEVNPMVAGEEVPVNGQDIESMDFVDDAVTAIDEPESKSDEEQKHVTDIKTASSSKKDDLTELQDSSINLRGLTRGNKSNQEMDDDSKEFNPRGPNFLPGVPDPDAETVDLKHQTMDERKNAEEWMVDFALQQAVTTLAPARKKRVSLLVEAFEKVLPIPKYETQKRATSKSFTNTRQCKLAAERVLNKEKNCIYYRLFNFMTSHCTRMCRMHRNGSLLLLFPSYCPIDKNKDITRLDFVSSFRIARSITETLQPSELPPDSVDNDGQSFEKRQHLACAPYSNYLIDLQPKLSMQAMAQRIIMPLCCNGERSPPSSIP